MMRRTIGFLVTLALCLLKVLAVDAQPRRHIPVVGILSGSDAAALTDPTRPLSALGDGLRALGYVEGQTIRLEYRFAEGQFARLAELVAELVRLPVDVLVASGSEGVAAAQHATQTIPIVMHQVGDPVQRGFVASLAQPGGNITGVSNMADDVFGKQLELLTELVSPRPRVAILWNPLQPAHTPGLKVLEGMARAAGVQLHPVAVHRPDELDGAFAAMHTGRAEALMIFSSALHTQHLRTIVDLTRQHRLPAVAWERTYAEGGLLMTYGPNTRELYRRVAYYVDRLLRGAKPGDLPIEQPTRFEFVINLKTAQALGLTIPPSLLFQATEVLR